MWLQVYSQVGTPNTLSWQLCRMPWTGATSATCSSELPWSLTVGTNTIVAGTSDIDTYWNAGNKYEYRYVYVSYPANVTVVGVRLSTTE
jgi:hypothetical protein